MSVAKFMHTLMLLQWFYPGLDYRVLESQVVFETGTVESCTEIEIVDDSLALERRETIVVSFTPPSGTQQGSPPSTTVTILDNDGKA